MNWTVAQLPKLREAVARERSWIEEHGGDLAGYVQRYGSKDDPEHYGDGGEAIYKADLAKLRELEDAFWVLQLKQQHKLTKPQINLLGTIRRAKRAGIEVLVSGASLRVAEALDRKGLVAVKAHGTMWTAGWYYYAELV